MSLPWKDHIRRIGDELSMLWKRVLSYRKGEWNLADYPVVIRTQEFTPGLPARFTQHRYRALLLGWLIDGLGDSKQEALTNLDAEFARRRQMRIDEGEPVPRPGTRVPIKFAPQARVDRHTALADDFIRRVLHPVLGIEDIWITDDSSLWNFHFDKTSEELVAKIREVYGVDVSDIESEKLVDIFDRIEAVLRRSTR
jgi:hypothetical protein